MRLFSSVLSAFELFEEFFSSYKWIPFLSLFPVRDTALGLCSMSESSLSVRLWKPDNPLMESTGGYCCVHPPHLPSNTYEDLLKERAEQREPALTWQATMATGKGAGRTEAGGRHTRGWWELRWPACGGHNAQVELTVITQAVEEDK